MAGTPKTIPCMLTVTIMVVLATIGSMAKAAIIPGTALAVTVSGVVYCSANGSPCSGCPPLVGAKADLKLNSQVLSTTNTQLDGSFKFYVNNVQGILAGVVDTSAIKVWVHLPVASCPTLATASGALVGTSEIRGVANNGALVDLIVRGFTLDADGA